VNIERLCTAIKHIARVPEAIACLGAMEHAPKVVASYIGLAPLPLPYTARFRDGMRYRLDESYDLETLWQINFHALYPLRASDRVIVDAGANIGLFTCWAAARVPDATIVAVEPSPANFQRLVDHVRANGFAQRVIPLQIALDATATVAWLSGHAAASQMMHLMSGHAPGALPVETWTLSDLIARIPEQHIDLLKMDIEGSEYPVLMSAGADQLARVGRISLEYHEPPPQSGYTKRDLLRHLAACGFASIHDRGGKAAYGMIHASRC